MSRSSLTLLLAIILIALVLLPSFGDAKKKKKNPRTPEEREKLIMERLPLLTEDKNTSHILKCQACKVSAIEMQARLSVVRLQRTNPLPEHEGVEILEAVCDNNMKNYGLLIDDDDYPTTAITSDPKAVSAKGAWVTRYLQGVCGDVFNDATNFVLDNFENNCEDTATERRCKTAPFVHALCVKNLKVCSEEEAPLKSPEDIEQEAKEAAAKAEGADQPADTSAKAEL
mmetsp:Transcript_19427/g.45434  ORF Transcript_19427/g.45434 Transcript_19427/m.45434 type:complete len:228 (-) Transcript_19427:125-808(-)